MSEMTRFSRRFGVDSVRFPGSNFGVLARARISPLEGSITMADPPGRVLFHSRSERVLYDLLQWGVDGELNACTPRLGERLRTIARH